MVYSYFWANIAIDDTSRLNKLILMAIGGFGTLVLVSIGRHLPFEMHTVVPFPDWVMIQGTLSIETISNLAVPEAANLILSQSLVGVLLGACVGSFKYIFFDVDKPRRQDLEQPWEYVNGQISRGSEVTVITTGNERIHGMVERIGSPSEDYDLLLGNPIEVMSHETNGSREESGEPFGEMSYHHHQDIARIHLHEDQTAPKRTWVTKKHMFILQRSLDLKSDALNTKRKFFENPGNTSLAAIRYLIQRIINPFSRVTRRIWTLLPDGSEESEEEEDKLNVQSSYSVDTNGNDSGSGKN